MVWKMNLISRKLKNLIFGIYFKNGQINLYIHQREPRRFTVFSIHIHTCMIDVILKYFNPNPKNKHFIEEMVVFLKKQEISRATILWTGPQSKSLPLLIRDLTHNGSGNTRVTNSS